VLATLIVAVILGTAAVFAIRRAARRRAALADELAARLPAVPRTRLLDPWRPTADADEARAVYCADDADPAVAAARFIFVLTGQGWRLDDESRDPRVPSVRFALAGSGYRLHGVAQPGGRATCDSARRQALLTVEVARTPGAPALPPPTGRAAW
jgi:hypothetical protein